MNTNWMNNKTVIITGASGGMGKGVAERLIKEHGCTVIGIARSEEKMKKVVEEEFFPSLTDFRITQSTT